MRVIVFIFINILALFWYNKKNFADFIYLSPKEVTETKKVQNFSELNSQTDKVKNQFLAKDNSKNYLSVKDFGAVGNGTSDDTKAIQLAIDTVHKNGGGTVFFPKGTYKVSINPSHLKALIIRNNITLQGDGNQNSIIKLANQQGNYIGLLAGERPDSDLSDFSMYDLAIDANSHNNPVNSESDFNTKKLIGRYALQIYIGSKINIERCRFKNQNGRNVITLNGNTAPYQVSVSNILIKDNIFESIGGSKIDYDHSTIYTHGEDIKIINNKFYSRDGAGTKAARTAIETHGDKHIVKSNFITGFTNGMNITGFASSSDKIIVSNNIINDTYFGIILWSYFSDGNTLNPALSNCWISNNQINLNVNAWRNLVGDIPSRGIALEPNSDAPMMNVYILDNSIVFNNFSDKVSDQDNLANGIRLWQKQSDNIINTNINIIKNTIKNSLASGVYVSMNVNEGRFSENKIINAGQGKNHFNEYYRTGLIISGDLNNVKINKNKFIDNQDITTLFGGLFSDAVCKNNCEIQGNIMEVSKKEESMKVFRSTPGGKKNFHILP